MLMMNLNYVRDLGACTCFLGGPGCRCTNVARRCPCFSGVFERYVTYVYEDHVCLCVFSVCA